MDTQPIDVGADKPTPYVPPVIVPIKSTAEYYRYAEKLKDIKGYIRKVEGFFAPHKERARAAWQGLVDEEKAAKRPAEETEKAIKRELTAYDDEQEALRLAEQKRLEEDARKKEEQRRLEEAAALESEGARTGNADLVQQAQELLEEPVETPSVQLASFVPKVSGLSFKESYSAEVTDLKSFIKWVAKNVKTHANLLKPDQTALNQLARAQRENLKIDGVKVKKTKGAASGVR